MAERKYPIGIQTFSEVIRGRYVYVDKTDLVWQLAHYAKFIFMSRPRRFGKSLLTSTLESYFRGERELFEGLKIMGLEQEWEQYPVLRFDLSGAKHLKPEGVSAELSRLLDKMETVYGVNPKETTPGMRHAGLIDRAYALDQINDKGYAIPYKTDGRKIVKIGVKFKAETRTPENWIIEQFEPLIIVKCLGKVLSVSKKCVPLRNEC